MTDDAYFDELQLELRRRETSGRAVTNHLAEALSHIADTGADPSIEFGQPDEFARELAGAVDWSSRIRRMTKISAAWLVTFAFGYFVQRNVRGFGNVLYLNNLVGVGVVAVGQLATMVVLMSESAGFSGNPAAARRSMLKVFVPFTGGIVMGIALIELLPNWSLVTVPLWVAIAGVLVFGGWATLATEQDRRDAKLEPVAIPVSLSQPFSRWTGIHGWRTAYRLLRDQ